MSDECIFIPALIECVKEKKCLYDKSDPFYFNQSVKDMAWADVAQSCNKSVTECKHRWKLLCQRLVKELKKKNVAPGNQWPFLQSMMFVKESLDSRRTQDKLEDSGTNAEETTFSTHSFGFEQVNLIQGQEETSDELYMKTFLSLMKDLPLDVKEELQLKSIQELICLKLECKNNAENI